MIRELDWSAEVDFRDSSNPFETFITDLMKSVLVSKVESLRSLTDSEFRELLNNGSTLSSRQGHISAYSDPFNYSPLEVPRLEIQTTDEVVFGCYLTEFGLQIGFRLESQIGNFLGVIITSDRPGIIWSDSDFEDPIYESSFKLSDLVPNESDQEVMSKFLTVDLRNWLDQHVKYTVTIESEESVWIP